MKKNYQKSQSGYIVLLTVILLGTIGAVVASALILLGLANSQTNFTYRQSRQAKSLADSCVETALLNLVTNPDYRGDETISINKESCQILPLVQDSGVYTIKTIGVVGNVYAKILVHAERATSSPFNMTINSWRQVADF